MSLLAIDPGTTQSGFVVMSRGKVVWAGVKPNADMLKCCAAHEGDVAIEMIESMGMAVGKETFETVRWIGRFQQAARNPEAVKLVYRKQVKLHLCGTPRAKDPNVRQALIDKFGGDSVAIGKKSAPGPLYSVKSHAWPALGVAVTARGM